MSSNFKGLRSDLQENGYQHHWKLLKEKDILNIHDASQQQQDLDFYDKIARQTTKLLCQNIDLILPLKHRTQNQQLQLQQFLNIIGKKLNDKDLTYYQPDQLNHQPMENNEPIPSTKEVNEDKRQYRIQEFIKTEKSYVDTLNAMVKYVVQPLKVNNRQHKNGILNTFKCQKIFLNIDQIAAVNQQFLNDLMSADQDNFGDICQKHIARFECYRKFLLEQSEAQKLHSKESKMNPAYKRFLTKVSEYTEFKRKRLQDILVEPVQRISRYSMMLREILQLTPIDHADYIGLQIACQKAKEIATMADDDPTKVATMFLNLYQSIKDSPCSLINQKRMLVTHVDAVEIHRVTNKPTRAVTLFLFTDKILVASKSSMDSKEIDLQQLLDNSVIPTRTSSATLLSSNHHHNTPYTTPYKQPLKFKGWSDIENIELFGGVADRPDSFILSTTHLAETDLMSFERYFHKGPRLFQVKNQSNLQNFQDLYQRTRAFNKKRNEESCLYYKQWRDTPLFCNTNTWQNYIKSKHKNDSCVIYMDDQDTFDIQDMLPSHHLPWIIGVIQPEKLKGFRFQIYTKIQFSNYHRYYSQSSKSKEQTLDFEHVFWNNMIYLNQHLRKSIEYSARNILPDISQKRISRTSSISSLGKIFQQQTRSVSPSKQLKKSKSTHLCLFDSASTDTTATKDKRYNTISSIESSTTDEDEDEENEKHLHNLKSNHSETNDLKKEVSPAKYLKTTVPTQYENLECIFKSNHGFEDEMQQQWKDLISKYELINHSTRSI